MNNITLPNKRAFAILRISSRRQKDGISHEVQEKEVRDYCQENGLELVGIEKIIESAKNSEDRKKYIAAISRVLREKIGCLLFYMQDRETRNLTDIEQNEIRIREGFLTLHYVRDRKVLHQGSPSSEFLSRDMHAIVHKQYLRDLSVKVSDAMKYKAKSGWYPSNRPPLGYVSKHTTDENGKERKRGTIIVPDPDLRKTIQVRREFELRAEGFSFGAIRTKIIAEGLVPPEKAKKYHDSAIEYRLNNKFYRGYFDWQGVEYAGKHELIIPLHILRKVDQGLRVRGYRLRDDASTGVFAGERIKCGVEGCGCALVYDPKKKTNKKTGKESWFHYYRCSNNKSLHESMKGLNVTEETLFEKFGAALDRITTTDDFANQIRDALNETHQKSRRGIENELRDLQVVLKSLDDKIATMVDMMISGKLGHEEYQIAKTKIQRDKDNTHERMRLLTLMIHDSGMETVKTVIELATNAKSLWESRSPAERKGMLDLLLSNPLWDGVTLQYELKKPFTVLAGMRGNSQWRTQLGSNQQPPDS